MLPHASADPVAGDNLGVYQRTTTDPCTITASTMTTGNTTMTGSERVAGNIRVFVKSSSGTSWVTIGSVIHHGFDTSIIDPNSTKYGETNQIWNYYVAGAGNTFNASNYTVTIEGGNLNAVYGAYAMVHAMDASNNTVTVQNGTINNLIGAYTKTGNANNNTVIVAGGTIDTIRGGLSQIQSANGNIVTINGNPTITGGVYGADASTTASDNTVNINGGTITGPVVGGYTVNNGSASNNIINITSGKIYTSVSGGKTTSGNATGNVVNIAGGTLTNTIISGGVSTSGDTTNNTVNILAANTLKTLKGGSTGTGTSSGNTINFAAKDVTITDNIYSAQNINFYLPSNIAANDTMVNVTGNSQTTLSNVTVGAAALSGVSLNKGDSVTLLHNANGFDGTAAITTLTTAPTATSLTLDTSYKLDITQSTNDITATVTDKTESSTESSMERAKSLVETRAATTTFINAGADMLSSQGFMQAANAVALEAAEQTTSGAAGMPSVSTFTPFAAIGGSSLRAESGSYVDTKGFGLNVGFAREIATPQGKLLFGPVVEYGGGNYDSYLEDAAGTHGEGKAHYFGVGLMARQVNHDGLYYEGSLRGGRVNSDYKSTMDTLGKVDYDSSSNYFAAHLGVGKAFSIGNGNTLDGYLKYFYSHQAGDTTTIHIENAADERGSFSSVDSHRLRIGARLTHKVNDKNSFYGGLAYQYEFGGEARAHFSSGGNVPSPSVKGGSGMLELGWQVKPGETPLTLDLGLTGWAGKQRGGSVQLGATWKF